MDPYDPPNTPARPAGPEKARWGGLVPLTLGGLSLPHGIFGDVEWHALLLTFLFTFTGLLISRGKAQRVAGIFLSGISGTLCVIRFLPPG